MLNQNPRFFQMRNRAHRDHLTSYLRCSVKIKAVTSNSQYLICVPFLISYVSEFQPKLVVNQPTINNKTYDVTGNDVIKLTTAFCEKAEILRISAGNVCSYF